MEANLLDSGVDSGRMAGEQGVAVHRPSTSVTGEQALPGGEILTYDIVARLTGVVRPKSGSITRRGEAESVVRPQKGACCMLTAEPPPPAPMPVQDFVVSGRYQSSGRQFPPYIVQAADWYAALRAAQRPGLVIDSIAPFVPGDGRPRPGAEPPSEAQLAAEDAVTMTRAQAEEMIRLLRSVRNVGQWILVILLLPLIWSVLMIVGVVTIRR
jgi:hypothetical protein